MYKTHPMLRRRFLKVVNVFSLFCNYLPMRQGMALWIPFTQGCFVPSLKMWKVYRRTYRQTDRQTGGQTDDGRQVIRKAHLSCQLMWAKNRTIITPFIKVKKIEHLQHPWKCCIHVKFDIIIRHINDFTRNFPENFNIFQCKNNVIE